MKKKGLIISTIVMMLVVVVALSTATYAWFSVSADAKISTLTVQTASSDGLQIAAIYNRGGTTGPQSGTMTLDPGINKTWNGADGYGAELLFETALSAAYGVSGDGLEANMYTAASQSVTAYATTAITDAWWKVQVDPDSGIPDPDQGNPAANAVDQGYYIICSKSTSIYTNSIGTQPAAGANFNNGKYSGQEYADGYNSELDGGYNDKYVVYWTLTQGSTYYIRTLGYANTKVTPDNAPTYKSNTDTIYYTDNAATVLVADEALKFAAGKYIGDVAGDLVGLYVRNVLFRQIMDAQEGEDLVNGEPAFTGPFYSDSICTKFPVGNASVNEGTGIFLGTVYTDLIGLFYNLGTTPADEVPINWSYEPNNNATDEDGLPRHMILANPNIEYFQLNFALRSQRAVPASTERSNIADIFFKKLDILATGGMAASARVALFEYRNNTYLPGTNNADVRLRKVFVPFANSTHDGTSWADPETAGNFDNFDNKFATVPDHPQNWKAYGFAYNATIMGAFDLATVRQNAGKINDASVWQTAKFFNIDKNVDWNSLSLYTDAQAVETTQMMSIGAFSTANAIKYYQLVIWFEGTDPECRTTFAGSGVTVDIAFDFYQRWTGASAPDYTGWPVTTFA